jgi:hypothetical protein
VSQAAQSVFHEVQSLRLLRLRILLAIPPVLMMGLVLWQMVLGHPWGKHPMSDGSLIGWTIFLWLVYFRLVTVRLVTDVRPGELSVAMRGLWRARRVPLGEIKSAKAVTYDPVRDWGGFGIRTTRQGQAYIAGGKQGVRLELTKGGVLLIGSERSEELERAICASRTT